MYVRAHRWKGMEDTLDECIDDTMRTLDQMCFSSQYYMMLALYTNGLFLAVIGMEMMIRSDYNLWADPAFTPILVFVVVAAAITERLLLFMAKRVSQSTYLHNLFS